MPRVLVGLPGRARACAQRMVGAVPRAEGDGQPGASQSCQCRLPVWSAAVSPCSSPLGRQVSLQLVLGCDGNLHRLGHLWLCFYRSETEFSNREDERK